ncbi:MmcQ/YjbR family DNA-binding protein [Phenylobacterium sp. 20VBR1]|uniref:MmcQ/YjbR family DNA-binding protein n=1 Tax=Phenylobacterium glaciei TaxID=2803784 RepID=A0A941HXY0_9CAUL|nr:MmcQ/YjbR family DNA-binding protein [Phenylobacterium glaciei]MBR7621438.1 MmcQ/YjbR family DNA-binding protein [Phenylobacterium glaciei]QQZ50077.1 MmcQ/YjbR family DNA-binding protein [Phenylobacterium glaciei]
MLSPDPDAVLVLLRDLALALPETDEVVSHGIPAFRAAGKMFAYFRHDHHGDGTTVVCVKTSGREVAEMLIEADPAVFSKPAYLWPSGWVGMSLVDCDWEHVAGRLATSWRLAAPKRLVREL